MGPLRVEVGHVLFLSERLHLIYFGRTCINQTACQNNHSSLPPTLWRIVCPCPPLSVSGFLGVDIISMEESLTFENSWILSVFFFFFQWGLRGVGKDAEAAVVIGGARRVCRVRIWRLRRRVSRRECRVSSFSSILTETYYLPPVFNFRFFSLLLSCWDLSVYKWALMQYYSELNSH